MRTKAFPPLPVCVLCLSADQIILLGLNSMNWMPPSFLLSKQFGSNAHSPFISAVHSPLSLMSQLRTIVSSLATSFYQPLLSFLMEQWTLLSPLFLICFPQTPRFCFFSFPHLPLTIRCLFLYRLNRNVLRCVIALLHRRWIVGTFRHTRMSKN